MPDISMCNTIDCELKDNCYRFRAKPHPYRQAYAAFEPKDGECDGYWPIDDTVTPSPEEMEKAKKELEERYVDGGKKRGA